MARVTEDVQAEEFDWGAAVPMVMHPLQVAIIEALLRHDRPLSASDITNVFDRQFETSHVAYHLRTLKALKLLKIARRRQVRNVTEKFYTVR